MEHQEIICNIINNFVVIFMTLPQIFPVFYSDRSVSSGPTVVSDILEFAVPRGVIGGVL
jgi:hypothetical protein